METGCTGRPPIPPFEYGTIIGIAREVRVLNRAYHTRNAIPVSKARPPITPPTIAPMGTFLVLGLGASDLEGLVESGMSIFES